MKELKPEEELELIKSKIMTVINLMSESWTILDEPYQILMDAIGKPVSVEEIREAEEIYNNSKDLFSRQLESEEELFK